jgi:hypothetical protein
MNRVALLKRQLLCYLGMPFRINPLPLRVGAGFIFFLSS